MIYAYLLSVSELNRIFLYQYSDKSKVNPGSWTLPVCLLEEGFTDEDFRVGLYKLFQSQLQNIELYETHKAENGDSYVFYKADLNSDIELKDKKADYGFYTFQQLHYFNLPKIQKDTLGKLFASQNN